MGEILVWILGGMAFLLFALFFLSMVSAVEEVLRWMKRRWL